MFELTIVRLSNMQAHQTLPHHIQKFIKKEIFFNTTSVVDENDKEIIKLKEEGKTLQFIATKFNVSPQAISRIIKKINERAF